MAWRSATARGLVAALRNPIVIGIRRYELKRGEKYPAKNGRQVDRKKIKREPPLEVRIVIEPLITKDLWGRAEDPAKPRPGAAVGQLARGFYVRDWQSAETGGS